MRRKEEHLLSIRFLLGIGDKAVNKIDHVPALMDLMSSGVYRQVKKNHPYHLSSLSLSVSLSLGLSLSPPPSLIMEYNTGSEGKA